MHSPAGQDAAAQHRDMNPVWMNIRWSQPLTGCRVISWLRHSWRRGGVVRRCSRQREGSEKPACREDRAIMIMSASWKQLFFQMLLLLVSCRHINTKTPGSTPLPLSPISPLPTAVREVVLEDGSQTEKVELVSPVNLTLKCTRAADQDKPPTLTGFWRKDGGEIESSRVTLQLKNGQYYLKRAFSIISEKNLGIYSCVFASEAKLDFVLAVPQIGEVRDKPIVGYVGDSAVVTCKVEGKIPPSTWNWYKANGTDKEQILAAAEPHRYEIKNEDVKTKLLVHNLTEADSGLYYCGAVYTIGTTMGHVELKVITFLEPLKPFAAIVLEVIVLVIVILLCERSRSRKNYTEGNETTDQTNTLTAGENNGSEGSSSMRQRKV